MKKIVILQLRPDEIAETEFSAFLKWGELNKNNIHRIRMEENGIPVDVHATDYAAVVVGGGPSNVSDDEEKKSDIQKKFESDLFRILDEVVENDVPYFGACYGFGILSKHRGACVSKEKYSEDVTAVTIKVNKVGMKDELLKGLPTEFRAFVGHKEACQSVPKDAILLASSDTCPVQMYRVKNNIYATQFHPEMDTEEIINRINVYKHAGYFPPEDAGKLIKDAEQENIIIPQKIFKRFVNKYYRGQ
ncbi:MAG: glutamine amidotransferase [Candidatus Moraniibacteriota bacterium]|nr:MAG: glutamine amidotransferase [Candidatus Moranbacteria bacterium]